jgi:hypothetical protein
VFDRRMTPLSGRRSVSLLGLACFLIAAMPVEADARCRYLVIAVDGQLTEPLSPDTPLVLWPTPPSLNSDTTVRRDGRRFRAMVQYYPGGADASGNETCVKQPMYIIIRAALRGGEREVARLAFPARFTENDDGTWTSRRRVTVHAPASQ